jgi:peptidoglycan-N-acetylglucosamine deacetylase
MRRITVLAAAGAIVVAVGGISFTVGRAFTAKAPVAAAMAPSKVADSDLVTGSIASRTSPGAPMSQSPMSAPAAGFPPATVPVPFPTPGRGNVVAAIPGPKCTNPDALGVSRVVEVDTTGGPGFGFEQYKAYDFLEPGEVVLTFDDGPWPVNTPAVLAALAAQCVKATFFPIGKHSTWHPEILKQVVAAGHTVGSHTWSHADLSKKTVDEGKDEIENGISAVAISAGRPLAPLFRFPDLRETPELRAYLGQRNIGIFSTDLDSFDFKIKKPELVVASVMTKLQKRGKGIILMHDFQRSTALALPALLAQLKAGGYKVVWVKAKDTIATLPQYDAAMQKVLVGQTADARPTASVVRTISGNVN